MILPLSWILGSWPHEPPFADQDPPSLRFQPTREFEVEETVSGGMLGKKKESLVHLTERVPQLFVELSPAVIGEEARDILSTVDMERGGNYSLSSPKRYTWDDQQVGKNGSGYWTMVLNRWNEKAKSEAILPTLAGSMLRFFYGDGREWEISEPPNESADGVNRPSAQPQTPSFPRKDSMAWAALAIIELAYRQITSEEWRKGRQPFIPRRLRSVFVAFPFRLDFRGSRDIPTDVGESDQHLHTHAHWKIPSLQKMAETALHSPLTSTRPLRLNYPWSFLKLIVSAISVRIG